MPFIIRLETGVLREIKHKYLQKYIDEAIYRFNYKEDDSRLIFDNVLKITVA